MMDFSCLAWAVRAGRPALPGVMLAVLAFVLASPSPARSADVAFDWAEGDDSSIVLWRGRPIITGFHLNADAPGAMDRPEGRQRVTQDGWRTENRWRVADVHEKVTYRQEIGVKPGMVDMTVQFRVPPWHVAPQGQANTYSFDVPLERLRGYRWQAWVGRLGKQVTPVTGELTDATPDGALIPGRGSTSFIAFEDGKGGGLIFDANPMGVTTFSDSGQGSQILGSWSIRKMGDRLRFSFGGGVSTHNGLYTAKMRLLEGTMDDYHNLHAHHKYSYYDTVPAITQWSLGQGDRPEGWQAVTADDARWTVKPARAQVVGDVAKGLLHGRLQGSGPATLRVDVPQPGIYLFTVRVAADKTAIGPFDLHADGSPVARQVRVAPGHVTTLTFGRYVQGSHVDLAWQGDWAVSTVAVQAKIYAYEDFSFKRGVWLVAGVPSPSPFFHVPPRMPPTEGAIDTIPWVRQSPSADQLAKAAMPPAEALSSRFKNPANDWRWQGNVTSLGPSNYGSFLEFETPEQIARRLDELKAKGFGIILLNGLHFRHSWPDQMDRVRHTMALIAKLGHERGMSVLDHCDLSVAVHQNVGYNVYMETLPQTLRDVRTGQLTRGWCISNPDYQQAYDDQLRHWVRVTDIDGLMLDEISFHRAEFCGCQHCRAKFLRDTGVALPVDENHPSIGDVNDRLWKLWLTWRNRQVGDWKVRMLKAAREVKPDFQLMSYTTNYGLSSHFVTRGQAGGLHEAARSDGFMGTEIMSRNVYVAHRANFAFRNVFGSLGHAYDVPIFGLVYAVDNPVTAYAGWVMNNMRGQVTWSIISTPAIEKDAARYIGWQDNMDLRHATSAAKVALVFSIPSRDFPSTFGHTDDLLGLAEQLDDLHVPYDVLSNVVLDGSRPGVLDDYGLVILPSVCAMSDAEWRTVERYLRQGGHVLATGHSAVLDELGQRRDTWPIGRLAGLAWQGSRLFRGDNLTLQGRYTADQPVAYPQGLLRVTHDGQGQVLAAAHVGNATQPAIVRQSVGKGVLTVSLLRFGAVNYEREITINQPWVYEHNQPVADVLARLMEDLLPATSRFKAVAIPSSVRLSVYDQPASAKGGAMTVVHLYNAGGASIPVGQNVPTTPPAEPFPPLADDLVFEVTLPAAAQGHADAVSPDWPDARPVQAQSLGQGRWRVTVSAKDLQAYTMIRLR